MPAIAVRVALWAVVASGLSVACSSSEPAVASSDAGVSTVPLLCELGPNCRRITQACMPKDDVSNKAVHACHEEAMGRGVEADCQRDLARCVATCDAVPGFTDGPSPDVFAVCRDGGAADSGTFTFPSSPLVTFASDGKDLSFELRTAPQQPVAIGPVGEGELRVSNVSDGTPADGLNIAVATWMPVMNHACSPVPVKVSPQGGGVYLLSPFLASMKGACQIKLTLSGEKSERAVSPTFDITQ